MTIMSTEQESETSTEDEPDLYCRGRKVWSGGQFSLGRGYENIVDAGDEVSMIIHHIETDTSFPIEEVKVRNEGKVSIPNPFVRTYKIEKGDVIDVYLWVDQPLIERGQA